MSNCATCYGLIMEPNKSYGYAGKVCNCTPPVYTQQPLSDSKRIEHLEKRIKAIEQQLQQHQPVIDRHALIGGATLSNDEEMSPEVLRELIDGIVKESK